MIPREILKNTRQIEIRMNRLVKISAPRFQLFRAAAGVEDRQNYYAAGFNQKMNYKRKTPENHSSPDFASYLREPLGLVRDALKVLLDGGAKFVSQTFALILIPSDAIVEFLGRNASKDEAAFHLRYFASSLALTSSKETTSSGWARWSCSRRSINSASPGVSSFDSTISSQRLRHNSICSASDNARASLSTISELMTLIYSVGKLAQLKIRHSMFGILP